jgi:hypothetical protein
MNLYSLQGENLRPLIGRQQRLYIVPFLDASLVGEPICSLVLSLVVLRLLLIRVLDHRVGIFFLSLFCCVHP